MNPKRGEYVLTVEDVGAVTLRLNMNALAEIEHGMGCKTLSELGVRLMDMGAKDILVILTALVKAGGDTPSKPVGEWPTTFSRYSDAIGKCLRSSGFIGEADGAEAKNEVSQ